jgi:heptaprenyl diphosphate synthase
MKSSTRKLSVLAVTVATAMILSFIESRLPTFVPIPGVKPGFANIAVIFALYKLGTREGVAVSLVRVCLSALLFGSAVSLIYSLAGAIFSLGVMLFLKKAVKMHTVGVSIAGGVAHNAGQIVAASVIMSTNAIFYYFPYLIISGTLAGIAVGIAANMLISRVKVSVK